MNKVTTFLVLLLSVLSATAQSHTIPTLDRNNTWTGVNSYTFGSFILGSTNQTCATGQVMTGYTSSLTPICQTGSAGGVSSVNTLTGAVVFAAGANVTLTPSGNTITIASTAGGGTGAVSSVNSITGAVVITAGANITVTPSGQNIAIASTAAAGITSINADTTAAQLIVGGTLINCPTVAGTTTCGFTGNSTTVNTLSGAVVLAAGSNITLSPSGNTITIASTASGSGTVTSVGLSVPSYLQVAGSPITTSGTLAITGTSQAANTVLAAPNGTAGALTPRLLVIADIPSGLGYITGLSGNVTASGTGVVAANVTGWNGVMVSSLGTGLLQNTTGTGVPTIATSYNLSGSGTLGTSLTTGTNTVACTTTPIFNAALGDTQLLTLTSACGTITSSSITGLNNGQLLRTVICQDATGGHAFPNPTWANGWTPVTQAASGCTAELFIGANGNAYADGYNSAFGNSSASPAVDGNAYRGYFVIPAGSSPTLQINTTAVGSQSIILYGSDQTIGTSVSPTVTCGSSDPAGPLKTTARGTGNFTVTAPGTITGNYCGTYTIVNP